MKLPYAITLRLSRKDGKRKEKSEIHNYLRGEISLSVWHFSSRTGTTEWSGKRRMRQCSMFASQITDENSLCFSLVKIGIPKLER